MPHSRFIPFKMGISINEGTPIAWRLIMPDSRFIPFEMGISINEGTPIAWRLIIDNAPQQIYPIRNGDFHKRGYPNSFTIDFFSCRPSRPRPGHGPATATATATRPRPRPPGHPATRPRPRPPVNVISKYNSRLFRLVYKLGTCWRTVQGLNNRHFHGFRRHLNWEANTAKITANVWGFGRLSVEPL